MPLSPPSTFPNGYQASDYGYLAMNYDPIIGINTSTPLNANGTVHVARLRISRKVIVTNVIVYVVTAGGTLTSTQNLAALYNASGTLLSSTGDQSTPWVTSGLKTMALSAAQTCDPGLYDVAFFSNGTTRPAFLRSQADTTANLGLTTSGLRIATADTGRSTTMPSPLGTKVVTNAVPYWVAVS